MNIERKVSTLLKSNMYILYEGDRCILVDPFELDLGLVNVDYIILTHEHYDHISGVNFWKEKTGAQVVASEMCTLNCKNSKKNLSRYFDAFCELQTWIDEYDKVGNIDYTCDVDITFEGSILIDWMGHKIEMVEIPGHSKGSVLVALDGEYYFSGDSILKNVATECGLPGGSKNDWEKISIPIINRIPKGATIYPGHLNAFVWADTNMSEEKYV